MKRLGKVLAIILAVNIFLGTFPNLGSVIFAAPAGIVNVYVDSYNRETGILTIRWDGISGAQDVQVEYLAPSATDPTTSVRITETASNITSNTLTFKNKLVNDIIYTMSIKIYRPGDTSTLVAEGFLCFLPGITFRAVAVEGNSDYEDIDKIGREIGIKPALRLTWSVPSVFDKNGKLVSADTNGALSGIVEKMSKYYGKTINADVLRNYIISIDRNDLGNNLVALSDIEIKYDEKESKYKANTARNKNLTAQVEQDVTTGELSLYLVGGKDESTVFPATDSEKNNEWDTRWKKLLPADLVEKGIKDSVLFDSDILPGTVYSMGIMPVYKDHRNLDVIMLGDPSEDQQSPLSDVDYVFTAMRFKLTKDERGNLNVIIYKVNGGSTNLPNLIYEIQSGKSSPGLGGDLPLIETIDDIYYPTGKTVYSSIQEVEPTNTDNYKVVAKSQAGARISSWNMPFRLADYISGPSVPNSVRIEPIEDEVSIEVVNPQTGKTFIEKTTDITISWRKPANWDIEVEPNTDPDKDLYYHVLLSTNLNDLAEKKSLEANGVYYGDFDVKYRRVAYFSSKAAVQDPDDPDRLMYTIKGDELFRYAKFTGTYDAEGNPIIEYGDIDNPEGYPEFLLPNTVYYLQMFTTTGEHAENPDDNHKSGLSDVKSFTTKIGASQIVSVPYNFNYTINDIDRTTNRNYVEFVIAENDVDIESFVANRGTSSNPVVNVYYELYMAKPQGSTHATDKLNFELIDTLLGSGKKSAPTLHVSVGRTGAPVLKPNTIYYFKVVTKLVLDEGKSTEKVYRSESSVIRSITTLKALTIDAPDTSNQKPLAPLDFTDKDDSGVSTVFGPGVTLSWTRQNDDEAGKDDVKYTIVITSARLSGNDELPTEDYVYDAFMKTIGSKLELLDPEKAPIEDDDIKFEYDQKSNKYRLTIKNWLDPNRLYFFSIRAVNNVRYSDWVCIPVTTPLIPEPTNLEAMKDYQLGFYWEDTTAYVMPEDYVIKIKKTTGSTFEEVPRSRMSITKDGSKFYARVSNLDPNTSYDVRVYRGSKLMTIYPETGAMTTRDSYHQLQVSWKGLPYGYKYELSIRAADESEYTTLTDDDLQLYTNSDGKSYPYYIEEHDDTAGNEYAYCYALIKSVEVTLSNGLVVHQPLKSNMKYYIRVRAVKVSADGDDTVHVSKYAGPVEIRTEFSQKDYDENEQEKEKETKLLDKVSRLEDKLYWRMNMSNSSVTKILVKGERMVNAVSNYENQTFTLDISEIDENIDIDVLYIPIEVFDAVNEENINFIVRTDSGDFIFRPGTLDTGRNKTIKSVDSSSGVKALFIKVTVSRGELPESSLPRGNTRISDVNELEMQVLGTSLTDENLKDLIHDRLYNESSGLVKAKLDILMNPYTGSARMTDKQLDQFIDKLVDDIEVELSEFIAGVVESSGKSGMVLKAESVTEFDVPMMIRLSHDNVKGLKQPYAYYTNAKSWKKISEDVTASYSTVVFNAGGTGKFAVFTPNSALNDVPDDYWAKDSIEKFLSVYDLTDVFAGLDKSFSPGATVSVKELILLYGKVSGGTSGSTGTSIKKQAQNLGLDKLLNAANTAKNVTREETAAVLVKLYCTKTGVDMGSLKTNKAVYIADDANISNSKYASVAISVDLGILELDEDGYFYPEKSITRAEMITALVKLLKLTGDITG